MNNPVYYASKLGEGLYAIEEKHTPTATWSVMMYLVIGAVTLVYDANTL